MFLSLQTLIKQLNHFATIYTSNHTFTYVYNYHWRFLSNIFECSAQRKKYGFLQLQIELYKTWQHCVIGLMASSLACHLQIIKNNLHSEIDSPVQPGVVGSNRKILQNKLIITSVIAIFKIMY